jgi:signal peptidase II
MNRLPYFLIALLLVGADRALKAWASRSLAVTGSRPLIGQVIRLTPVHNVGGALGILPGSEILFIIVSLVASIAIIILLALHRDPSRLMNTGLALVLAGAVGNVIDRLAYGYVFDFLEVRGLFVNNLADICVSVGVALIILRVLMGGERDRAQG